MFNLNTLAAVAIGGAAGYLLCRYQEAQAVPFPVPLSVAFDMKNLFIPVTTIKAAMQLAAAAQAPMAPTQVTGY